MSTLHRETMSDECLAHNALDHGRRDAAQPLVPTHPILSQTSVADLFGANEFADFSDHVESDVVAGERLQIVAIATTKILCATELAVLSADAQTAVTTWIEIDRRVVTVDLHDI